jgi:hypothetical protein
MKGRARVSRSEGGARSALMSVQQSPRLESGNLSPDQKQYRIHA